MALERLEFPLNHTQPVICLQRVAGSDKGGWLGSQKSCQLIIHGLLSWPLIDDGIGQGFQYEGLIAYRLCQVPERWGVAVTLLLGFLLRSGSLPVLPKEGSVH